MRATCFAGADCAVLAASLPPVTTALLAAIRSRALALLGAGPGLRCLAPALRPLSLLRPRCALLRRLLWLRLHPLRLWLCPLRLDRRALLRHRLLHLLTFT